MSNVLDWERAYARRMGCPRAVEPQPCPTELPRHLAAEAVSTRRSLYCEEYDGCLDVAIARGWPSWTCERCSRFALSNDLRAEEIRRAALLRLPSMEMPVGSALSRSTARPPP